MTAAHPFSTRRGCKVRKAQLRREPRCELCLAKVRPAEAKTVDHVIALKDGGAPYDPDNMRSLCLDCHKRRHGARIKRTFANLDHHVWRVTYKWAKRRHPRKNRRWVINHYYGLDQGRGWGPMGRLKPASAPQRDPGVAFREGQGQSQPLRPLMLHLRCRRRSSASACGSAWNIDPAGRAGLELDTLTIRIPMRLQRRCGRKLIMTPEGAAVPTPKPSHDEMLVKGLVRAPLEALARPG
jgi:hypothetical protein